ncbi:aminotransferase class III-fold pyridoxal phosphate-dependent enzyme [Streptomyces sp. NA04227]|uniref:aminotransferase class III-fold pyridoxal phosphate-dependent enzyme n=1 Tax=Streptomyces sp. NA04227 TaxID=2742136 RepID=UPI001591D022|nr:aminotransferase class III-fold pyridoxal phosphate-dependent enzyme [Streptomyces sp. NA04227]QKW09600.1 aminotransferase class III-fold pyridoxal phosphate-dependent enzyme [Streptomyces sp. NA04227]
MALTEPVTRAPGPAKDGVPRRRAIRESAARGYACALPVVPVRARGLIIEGADGRRYLDCLSGAAGLVLGHNHPVVLRAIREMLDSGEPLQTLDLATPVRDRFVGELLGSLPGELAGRARVRFCSPGGTDAVESALALVRAATGRTDLLTFTGARHQPSTAAPPTVSTPLPYPQDYRCPFGTGGERGAQLAARWAESLLDDPLSGIGRPAALLLEPVQDEGGVLPAPAPWLRRLRELTSTYGIALVADERRTGIGRTGSFWGVGHSGIVPEVMVLSGAVGGGMPLAVLVHHEDLGDPRDEASPGTVRGNQLAMAAGAATLAHVRRNGLAARAGELGARLLGLLRTLGAAHDCVGEVRGRGLMLGLELVDPAGTTAGAPPAPAPELARRVRQECLNRGLIVGLCGRHDAVVRLLPPLTLTDEQADAVVERLADALRAAAAARPPGTDPLRPDVRPTTPIHPPR